MAQLRPKIVKLAKIIGGVTGITTRIDENAPEYYCMAGILTDEEADVAIAAGLRKERTAAYLARKVGKTVQEVQPLLDNLVYYGIFRRSHNETLGEDTYYMQIFAPGILEMMVNQKELLDTHPEVGRAFEEYTRNLAANMGAMIPDGYGLMRVIPVESALEGIPGVNEFERISHYLDKYDRFSVSPCSCRASRTSIGDGCGHLDEDMCIQMGKGAEHYIRSGRAKEITREQALEIIKRAEENGLMHDMVNIEEPGESAAICNCCACACFGLRVGLMYGARDAIRSNYVAEVDEAKCVACGQCVETCPGNALKLGQKLCSTEDLTQKPDYVKLSETLHPKRTWDPNYREDHEDVVPTGTAPCKTACPAHIPVQGYLKLAAQGRYTDALELIKKENPFPAVCGRICNKRCEAECTRGSVDEAVAIDEVKRFIADHDLHEATRYVPKLLNQIGRPYTEKIAVIGAGPAGLSCAYFLRQQGYPVTVLEKDTVLGGAPATLIPSFRLDRKAYDAEIDVLARMGVEFRTGVEVGKDTTLDALRAEGYKAFFLGIGAGKQSKDAPAGAVDARRYLHRKRHTVKGSVVVLGGGKEAVDCARAARKGGAASVTVVAGAIQADISAAKKEGIAFHAPFAVQEIRDGAVSIRSLHGDKTETLAADTVFAAEGYVPAADAFTAASGVCLNADGFVGADAVTRQTGEADVFAGGAATGAHDVARAIAEGREAAISIHRFVHSNQSFVIGRDKRDYKPLARSSVGVAIDELESAPRQATENGLLSDAQLHCEAGRCLGCGTVVLNEDQCIGCGICTTKCKFDAIHLEKVNDTHGRGYFRTLLTVASNAPAAGRRFVRKKLQH